MALRSTVFKAQLQVNDLDRHYYASHALTLARHPSETDERLMVRLLAFGLNADESLLFGAGLSTDDEADLWQRDYTGRITLWIDVGLPDPRLVKKAAARADRVIVYAYGRTAGLWWDKSRGELERLGNLDVYRLDTELTQTLARLAERAMQFDCTVQDGSVLFSTSDDSYQLSPEPLLRPAGC
ncbi:YaeQ family protein [Derxia gummosa]|uniref:YaeQ family protein n=1 Tax=Derxia gummosa DSM 723 TaxID=1121388 RepID=A0A8B6X4A0_9BURK|nr:YaeQ family protein [Derxia gummosa]